MPDECKGIKQGRAAEAPLPGRSILKSSLDTEGARP